MDEICPIPARIRSLHQIRQMFMQICNDERIFVLLYQLIGFSAFVQLLATNSQINKCINRHEQVQVFVLQLKVKKLKERQFKRLYPNPFGIDFRLFNPYILPIYNQETELKQEQVNEEIEKEREKAQIKKLNSNDLITKKDWKKWKAIKSGDSAFNMRLNRNSAIESINNNQLKEQMNIEQQMRIINQAQKIVELDRQFKSKLLSESIQASNQIQALKNKHFVEKFLGKEISNNNNFSQSNNTIRKIRSNEFSKEKKSSQIAALSIQQYDEFHEAWSDSIRKRTIKKIFKTQRQPQYSPQLPQPAITTKIFSKISGDIGNFLQIPGFLTVVKSKFSSIFASSNQ